MTIDEALDALDNLTESWRSVGRSGQAKVQAEAVAAIREHLGAVAKAERSKQPSGKGAKR